MSVDFNAPQFVDFTSGEAFDIHDGADFCFEKIVVGEGIELGPMPDKNTNDKVDDLISILANATNLNKNNGYSEVHKGNNSGKQTPVLATGEANKGGAYNSKSKENQVPESEKKADIVGTTIPVVGSAIDLIYAQSQNKPTPPMPKAKTPCKVTPTTTSAGHSAVVQANSATAQNENHKRTLSTQAKAASDRPLLPMYKGVKFIPKLAHKQHSQEGQTPSKEPGKSSMTTSSTIDQIDELIKNHRPACMDGGNQHKPTIMTNGGHKEAPAKLGSNLTRSTPGKSASFKQQLNEKKANIISTFASNLLAKPKPAQKLHMPVTQSSDHHPNVEPPVTSELKTLNKTNMSSSLSNSKLPLSASMSGGGGGGNNSSMIRKKSESKPVAGGGLLHTEMRALKRHEYDQAQKEKERLAQLVKQDIEQEKIKKQQEEILKIRSKSNFRSNPIKHYKPVELKPSERPLTEPKSPQFNMTQSTLQRAGNSSMQSSTSNIGLANVSTSNAVANASKLGKKYGYSHDDVRVNY